ncbi:MAG: non-heme iron oxygenase ferredoxin subunit [Pikeienuella sp.]
MSDWIHACATDDIDEEDLIRWDHNGRTFAIYNTDDGFFATDGMCTHEEQSLDEGMVVDDVIECPLHGGRFKIATGKALSAPVCVDLKTYPVKVEGAQIYIQI